MAADLFIERSRPGSYTGVLEYLAQSNNSADSVSHQDRFKSVHDLTVLEIVNLLTIGISSLNIKQSVPNDVPTHNK